MLVKPWICLLRGIDSINRTQHAWTAFCFWNIGSAIHVERNHASRSSQQHDFTT